MKTLFVIILSALFVMGCSNNSEAPEPQKASEPSGQSLGGEAASYYICNTTLTNMLNGYSLSYSCPPGQNTQLLNFPNSIILKIANSSNSCANGGGGGWPCNGAICIDLLNYSDPYDIWSDAVQIAQNNTPTGHCLYDVDFALHYYGSDVHVVIVAKYRDRGMPDE